MVNAPISTIHLNVNGAMARQSVDVQPMFVLADFETYFVGEQRLLVHNCDRKILRVDTANVGDAVKTPEIDPDQFTKLKGGQGMRDQDSGLILKRWDKSQCR